MQVQFMPQLNSRTALHLNLFENQLLNTDTERDKLRVREGVSNRQCNV